MAQIEIWQKRKFFRKEKFLYLLSAPDEAIDSIIKFKIQTGELDDRFIKVVKPKEALQSHLDFTWK